MLTVATVLRLGAEYAPEHVIRIQLQVRRWLTLPHRFVCLTDKPSADYNTILLRHDWPKWWGKIELWREGLFFGPVLYLDLDTTITGPLDEVATGHKFTVLRNFWVPPGHARIGSGVMAWDPWHAPELVKIYERFAADPKRWMHDQQSADNLGDQGFIQRNTPIVPERWQDKHPGRVVSYRRHCENGIVPSGASIVCYGGRARPWNSQLWGGDASCASSSAHSSAPGSAPG